MKHFATEIFDIDQKSLLMFCHFGTENEHLSFLGSKCINIPYTSNISKPKCMYIYIYILYIYIYIYIQIYIYIGNIRKNIYIENIRTFLGLIIHEDL